ncbi:MAG: HesA/MoeB/ThiF family protein [Burkholderiaceae bacterium]|nr:HesA/MoeB/ThiF family protein [Burkholderiaceae bacterium]
MADHETLRHSRHALLDGIDDEGVDAIRAARVLIIGAGGLGCPAATYLSACGVGTLHLVDGDTVDATNLARQPLFGPDDIGALKVQAAAQALRRLNPAIELISDAVFADAAVLNIAIPQADVVLDCTDQWSIRQLINAQCMAHKTPLVSAAAIEWSGQLIAIDPSRSDHACYACIFDPAAEPAAHACGAYGVLSPLVGAMGCLQAAEAIKLIVRKGHSGSSLQAGVQRLSLLDMRDGRWEQLTVSRNPSCPVCATRSTISGD